jgi:Carboxypeptidase regulatory-like domain
MSMFSKRLGWVVPILALAVASLDAAGDQAPAQAASSDSSSTIASGPARAGGSRARASTLGSRPATILGSAWNADNTPIKGANLRLRNVVTGKIEAETKANETGEFALQNVDAGSYAVELVSDSGHVLAVGHVFTIAPGETVATFVRLTPNGPWAAASFSNTAATVAATAATVGIAAIRPSNHCQSPPCD